MPSRFTRRQLLGGIAVGGAATYSGYRFLPAEFVPAPILEQRTKRQSVPAVDTSLSVAPDALTESREHLREVVDRAEAAWEEVDESDVEAEREEFDRSLESSVEIGRERLAETEGADPTTEALESVRYGVNRAAWSLAAARAISEDYDPEDARERSNALSTDVNDFANAVVYGTVDPRRGLAYLYRAERAVFFARMKADNVPAKESGEEFDHRTVVEAIRSEIEARRWLRDAQAIYDFHRSHVADADGSADLEAHLDRTWQDFAERIDGHLPDRETAIERYFTGDDGPRERATNELFNNGYSAADDAHPPSFGSREGLLAYVAVEHAKALQHARGFTAAMGRLDSAFADGEVGMTLAARAKREAASRLRDLLADSDDPITRELAARPREEITIGDWPLGANPTFESEYPYAEASATYLLAAENLRHTPEVRRALLPDEIEG